MQEHGFKLISYLRFTKYFSVLSDKVGDLGNSPKEPTALLKCKWIQYFLIDQT